MTRDDIIRMAQEAGIGLVESASLVYFQMSDLERFAALVAAAEREECAQIAFNAKTYLEAAHLIRERGAP
jgi:hypothetical protein